MTGEREEELEIPDEDLVDLAREAMESAYAPYSKFMVGAAAVADTGRIFTGVNVENASYGLTVCAERVAVLKAVSEGERRIVKVAVVSSSGEITYPCGACRQTLREFSRDTVIVLADASGNVERHTLSKLLPHSFNREPPG